MIRDIDTLKFAEYNPRYMKQHDDTSLGNSMSRLGDISGITFNTQSGTLVTGHQRVRKLKEKYGTRVQVFVEQKLDEPDEYGTVGLGYVGVEGTSVRFSYREVSWDRGLEMAANYGANHIGGDDDTEKLAQLDYELSLLDNGADLLALTGQTEREIEKLLQAVGVGDDPEPASDDQQDEAKNEKLSFALSPDQREVVELALQQAKSINAIPHTNLDNINGTALYYIAKYYAENTASQNTQQASDTPTQTQPSTETPTVPASETSQPDLTSIPTA